VIRCKIGPNFDGVPGSYTLPFSAIAKLLKILKISYGYPKILGDVKGSNI
jgi:hypothetical protein